MKKLHAFLLTLFFVAPALAQERPIQPATQAEVNAGAIHNKFVAPDTLTQFAGGPTNGVTASMLQNSLTSGTNFYNGTVNLERLFPKIDVGTGLVGYAGPGHLTNTLAWGFTNLNTWDNIIWNTNGPSQQLEVIWVQNASNIWVHEAIQNTCSGCPLYVNSNATWVIYRNTANLYDVNTNTADYTGHTHGAIASDGGVCVATGGGSALSVTGWSYGDRIAAKTNSWRITAELLGSDPVLNFEVGGGGQSGNPFAIYWNTLYETLDVLPGGWVGVRTGFTNKFAPLLQFVSTTNQFGDGTQAILRGPDSNFQFVLREGANRWNNYYSFGDNYNVGGGHRFTTRGGGDKTEFVIATDLIYHGVPLMLETTNAISFAALGAGQLVLINTNGALLAATTLGTNAVYLAGTATSYGLGSSATNATLAVGTAGITNTLTINYRLLGFTGTTVTQTNTVTHTSFSRGTVTTPTDIVLQPNEGVRGSSCAAQSVQAL